MPIPLIVPAVIAGVAAVGLAGSQVKDGIDWSRAAVSKTTGLTVENKGPLDQIWQIAMIAGVGFGVYLLAKKIMK